MKKNLFKLKNVIQNYDWGSKISLQELFDFENINQEPQAELWMGAHPNGCSLVQIDDGTIITLSEFIDAEKSAVLSSKTAEKFGELPYLFKVLAVSNTLSIQVHPDKQEAEIGYRKEDELGIERKAVNRNYRDPNHKPELVYALTPYQAMNGFRTFDEIVFLFSQVVRQTNMPHVESLLVAFQKELTEDGLKAFFIGILSLDEVQKSQSLEALINFAHQNKNSENEDDLCSLIVELEKTYPDDIGLFSPLFLNVLTLHPGDAMYLDARTPHAYLKGVGLEVMANSDNVLRAGLTSKHIDIEELARCTLFQEKPINSLILEPETFGNKQAYYIPVPDFGFECFTKAGDESVEVNSAEIIFAIDANVIVEHDSGELILLKKGESVFIPAYAKKYSLFSKGRIARVFN